MAEDLTETVEHVVESTADRIRAFEDKVLGADVERHNGRVEDGHGSKFSRLHPAHKVHHAALHELADAEKAHAQAEQAAAVAAAKLRGAHDKVASTHHASEAVED